MQALVMTRRGVLGTLAALVVVGVCVRLGIWQLDRRAERGERNRIIAERLEAEPIVLDRVPLDTAGLTYRRVTLDGVMDDARAIVLAGRSRGGAPGVHLFSPVRLGTGAFLVNRGWLPAPDAATVDLEPVRLHGEVRFEGVLLPFPRVERETDRQGFQERWFRFDGDAIRSQYPYPVAPLYLRATSPAVPLGAAAAAGESRPPGSDDDTGPAPVPLEPPALDPGPHLSYAVQWFSFAAIALVGWAILVLQRARRRPDGAAGRDEER